MLAKKIPFLLASALCLLAGPASAWWNPDWAYRKAITLDTGNAGSNVASDTGEVQVLLRLHTGNFKHFLDVAEGGADLRVVAADDKTPLAFHVEKFDAVNELALIWVKLPGLKGDVGADAKATEAAAAKLYLYFGNPNATRAEPSSASYGPADALVYHFDGADGAIVDHSTNALPAPTSTALPVSASLIGPGISFDGHQSLSVADAPVLAIDPAKGWGFSLWVKPESASGEAMLLERQIGKQRLRLAYVEGNLKLAYVDAAAEAKESGEVPMAPATWHHVAVRMEGGQFYLLLDGREATKLSVAAEPLAGPVVLGAASNGSQGFKGEMDEFRIFSSVPSVGRLAFAAATEGPDGKGIAYLADESTDTEGAGESGEGHSSYFGVILNQVFGNKQAIVEQSVIGVCGVMALVAFAVMGLKQIYLARCRKASSSFLAAYDGLGAASDTDLTVLAQRSAQFQNSPLFRVYRQGIGELKRRIGDDPDARIHSRSLEAIGAAMDAVMVREGQRLNAQMVLLTIAISGGPFIGLLGTVVGVMVTFAAIAATGDVNINAIAPGMAAALLATTAGLAVAIPSLFGYNYLGSRVKELSADMHVFADEFLARMNERYGQD